MQLPTVKIKHPDGYAIINETDFVEGEDELYTDPADGAENDEYAGLTDEQLRAAVLEATGTAPHPNAKRETLIKKLATAS